MGLLDAPAIPKDATGKKLSTIAVGRLLRPSKLAPQDMPTVMASPPTVTVSTAGATSSITSAVNVALILNPSGAWSINPKFTPLGLPIVPEAANSNKGVPNLPVSVFSASTPTATIEFVFTGQKLEFQLIGRNARGTYRITVNGQRETLRGRVSPGSDGAVYLAAVDFGSAAVRRIGFEFSHIQPITGVNIGVNDTIVPTMKRRTGRLYAVTDSFGDGSTTGSALTATDTYPGTLAAMLGIQDLYLDGVGGTGFLNAGIQSAYPGRLAADIAAWAGDAPDIVLLQGSTNDVTANTANPASLISVVQAAVASVRAAWPRTLVVVTGNLHATGPLSGGDLTLNQSMNTGAAGADLFIDANGEGWFSGTGYVGHTTGSGNGDVLSGSDGIHPTQLGADYIASRIARDILNYVHAI